MQDRAPDSTFEALMYSLRSGIVALGRPDTLRRLSELGDAQVREVARRAQKFKPRIAPAWPEKDVQTLLAARRKIHGKIG